MNSNNKQNSAFDLAIIGGGPAGVAAGIYAARKKLKTVLITKDFRGQSSVSNEIQNWIGDISISGEELHKRLEQHLKSYSNDIKILEKENVTSLVKNDDLFIIKTEKGSEFLTKTVLITSGSIRKKIDIKGAKEYEGKGITYCATCDAPMYSGADVVVIGGGNSAFEAASQLLAYAKSVTILQRSTFRAEPITIERVLSNPKAKGITNADLIEIKGDKFVRSIIYKDKNTGNVNEIPATGIFVEIGADPSTNFVENGIVELNNKKQIIINHQTQKTNTLGIWAAGDCTDGLYAQNNIAVGDAIKAVEDIYRFLKS